MDIFIPDNTDQRFVIADGAAALLEGSAPHFRPESAPKQTAPAARLRSTERSVVVNGVELVYERLGRREDPAIILIMGLGGQLLSWPLALCEALVREGYQVIRFDNRDSGLSSKFDHCASPGMLRMLRAHSFGHGLDAPYRLEHMASDTIGLMDRLQLDDAHIVGVSMGGMIAQILAARYPHRVKSLVSMMSTSGAPDLPGPSLKLRLRLARQRATEPHAALADAVRSIALVGSPGYPRTLEELERTLMPQIERGISPDGTLRQLAAILVSGSREKLLPHVQAPTLILHGEADRLVPVAAAHDLLQRIPHARGDIVPGLGHDLPPSAIPRMTESLITHLRRASGYHA